MKASDIPYTDLQLTWMRRLNLETHLRIWGNFLEEEWLRRKRLEELGHFLRGASKWQ